MTQRRKSKALTLTQEDSQKQTTITPFWAHFTPNELSQIDLDKLKLLFELQEKQSEAEYERQLKLQQMQVLHNHEMLLNAEKNRVIAEKEKTLEHQFSIQKLDLYFKMFVATAALALGTVFVLSGHEQVGNFLLGGALTTITSGAVALMRASKQHDTRRH